MFYEIGFMDYAGIYIRLKAKWFYVISLVLDFSSMISVNCNLRDVVLNYSPVTCSVIFVIEESSFTLFFKCKCKSSAKNSFNGEKYFSF